MSRILIVEDERHLADGLRFNLQAEGHDVEVLETGEAGLDRLVADTPPVDLLILDVMLPGKDGFVVVSELRQAGWFRPVLILTARGRAEDVLLGFQAGADDYLPKPFELAILIARIHGLLRRHDWATRSTSPPGPDDAAVDRFLFAGKVIDFDNQEVRAGERTLKLTLMETNLLRYLIRHEGRAVPRKAILEEVWGLHEDTDTRAIDNFVVRLRRHIETEPARPQHLLTVRGVGYRFVSEPEDAAGQGV